MSHPIFAATIQDDKAASRPKAAWHALWTRSHCEQLVHDQLATKGFELFLPRVERWSRRAGRQHRISVPMFPGYVFLDGPLDKPRYLDVIKTRGLVQILGEGWDQLGTIDDGEIEALRRLVDVRVPVVPYAYLHDGQRVRITHGLFTDLVGILVRGNENRGLLVVSIELLRQSVAVQVDCTWVAPV